MNIHIKNFTLNTMPGFTLTGAAVAEILAGLANTQSPVVDGRDVVSDGAVVAASVPELGAFWPEQGGIRAAYMPPEGDQPGYSIIVPTDPAVEKEGLKWGPYDNEVKGLSERDGLANTKILAAAGKHPAAKFCADLKIGDHNDFYLMANREASLLRAVAPQLFTKGWHWTSTQYSANVAFVQDFSAGDQLSCYEVYEWRVRAVRRFNH